MPRPPKFESSSAGLIRKSTRFESIGLRPNLLVAVTVELAGAVSRTSGVAIRAGCGRLFPPARRQSGNRRSYREERRSKRRPQRDAERASEARRTKK
jgi:hypothetical protein